MKLLLLLQLYGLLTYVDGARPKHPRCLDDNRIAWRQSLPYTIKSNGTHGFGIVEKIFKKAMATCCIGHNHYNYTTEFKSQGHIPDILMDDSTKDNFEFVLPVQRDAKSKNFLIFPYVPLVVSPGLAVFIIPPKQGAEAILQSITDMWPFMVVMSIVVGIAGTVYWMLDSMTLALYGAEPEPFFQGVINGIWWAFVTMTTVGYGDIVPKTKPARIFSVLWVIVGLVFCGLCVSAITNGILISITTKDIELMNNNVAVLKGSEEYKYASKKQGITFEYDTVEEIARSLRSENVTIALIDTMVAGSYKELLKDFKLNKVIETMNSNGVIFVNDGQKFSKCIRSYIMDRQQDVLNLVAQNVKTVKYKSTEGDSVLIDPDLPVFRVGILSMLGTLLICILCGLTKDWIVSYLSKRKLKKKERQEAQRMMQRQEENKRELADAFNEIIGICDFFIRNLEKDGK